MSAAYAFACGTVCGMFFVFSEVLGSLGLFLVAAAIAVACWLYDVRRSVEW